MRIDEAWRSFQAHMGLPDQGAARACFYAGYIAGAAQITEAAIGQNREAKAEFQQQLAKEILAEYEAPREAKPS